MPSPPRNLSKIMWLEIRSDAFFETSKDVPFLVSFSRQNRPFSKMADENSNKSKLKTYTSTRKDTFAFNSNPAKLKIEKFTDVL